MTTERIHTFSPNDFETCFQALNVIDASELVLVGQAKVTFCELFAHRLQHPEALQFLNKFPVLKGYKCAAWEEGDPLFLGMAGWRSWFGYAKE